MKGNLRKSSILFLCFVLLLSLVLKPELVNANVRNLLTGHFLLIDGNYYEFEKATYQQSNDIVKISVDASDKKSTIVKDVTSWNIVTNGKTVYYSKDKAGKGIIYKMNIKSKKATKVLSGKDYIPKRI